MSATRTIELVNRPNAGMTIRNPTDGREYMILGSARKMLGDTGPNAAERWKGLWFVCDKFADTGQPVLRELVWIQRCEKVSPGQYCGNGNQIA